MCPTVLPSLKITQTTTSLLAKANSTYPILSCTSLHCSIRGSLIPDESLSMRILLWIVSPCLLGFNDCLKSFMSNFKIENQNTTIWIKVALLIFFRMFQLCPEYVWGHSAVSYLLESVLQYACGTRKSS